MAEIPRTAKGRAQVHLVAPRRIGHCQRDLPGTLRYLETIRNAVFDGRNVFLDMSACDHISAAGCIMLAAEVDRCRSKKRNSINGCYPNAEKARATMVRYGFHEHLDFRRPRLSRDPRQALRIHSGKSKPIDQGEALQRLATMASDLFDDGHIAKRVYGALDEAIGNVNMHAFDKDFADASGRWWIAGSAHSRKDGASFFVLDHGPGVPTVAASKMAGAIEEYWRRWPELCKGAPQRPSDRDYLLAAAELRRSGVSTGGRGRGFEEMIRLIDESADSGSVQVLSGNAVYSFRRRRPGANSLGTCLRLRSGFPGTLIIWKITKPRPQPIGMVP